MGCFYALQAIRFTLKKHIIGNLESIVRNFELETQVVSWVNFKTSFHHFTQNRLDRCSVKTDEINGTLAKDDCNRLKYTKETIANTTEKKDSEMLYNSKSESLPLINGTPDHSCHVSYILFNTFLKWYLFESDTNS